MREGTILLHMCVEEKAQITMQFGHGVNRAGILVEERYQISSCSDISDRDISGTYADILTCPDMSSCGLQLFSFGKDASANGHALRSGRREGLQIDSVRMKLM